MNAIRCGLPAEYFRRRVAVTELKDGARLVESGDVLVEIGPPAPDPTGRFCWGIVAIHTRFLARVQAAVVDAGGRRVR